MFLTLWSKKCPVPRAESAAEKAGRLFDAGLNCTQAVLQATTAIDDPRLLAMAEGFGGGVGNSKCLCGAVTGGVMALGLKGAGKRAGKLVAAFQERNRVTCCQGLSAPFQWLSREHLVNCRRLTMETAAEVERLLQG